VDANVRIPRKSQKYNLAASQDWLGCADMSNQAGRMPFVLTKTLLPTASPRAVRLVLLRSKIT